MAWKKKHPSKKFVSAKLLSEDSELTLEESAARFKVGAKVKVNKKGHDWHGKVGTVVKSKVGDRTKKDTFAVGDIQGLQSDHFKGSELTLVESNDFVELAKLGDYTFGSDRKQDISIVLYKGKEISSGDFDRGADGWFLNHKTFSGQKFFGAASEVVEYFSKKRIRG